MSVHPCNYTKIPHPTTLHCWFLLTIAEHDNVQAQLEDSGHTKNVLNMRRL
jgi:hypothetical protein